MKYELTNNTRTFDGVVLYQIKALRDIPVRCVKAGDLGGFIEKESNLSQEGDCWVTKAAKVLESAEVSGHASVRNTSVLRGTGKLKGGSALRGKCLMTISELSDNMILISENITKPIDKASPKNGAYWITWATDTHLHCGCVGHTFKEWEELKDNDIAKMDDKALVWWKAMKEPMMKNVAVVRDHTHVEIGIGDIKKDGGKL